MLLPNPAGNYHFLSGIEPYSSGVVADPGFEIIHVTLARPCPWQEGFDRIEAVLKEAGRPRAALCGIELRSPAPFTRAGFIEFNQGYCRVIEAWELLVDGRNPVARTNVAPQWAAPAEPSLYGFSYTMPLAAPAVSAAPTFVVAGGGDLRGGPLMEAQVVRPGETSEDALREKAAYVMHVMEKRLTGLGRTWADATAIDIYTPHALPSVLGPVILDPAGPAAIHGVRWFPSRPPIDELEYEMDVRGVRTELVLMG